MNAIPVASAFPHSLELAVIGGCEISLHIPSLTSFVLMLLSYTDFSADALDGKWRWGGKGLCTMGSLHQRSWSFCFFIPPHLSQPIGSYLGTCVCFLTSVGSMLPTLWHNPHKSEYRYGRDIGLANLLNGVLNFLLK